MRPGEGITGVGGGGARADHDRRARAPRPALQALPEPARGRVRVDPGRADPGAARSSRARSTSARARRASYSEAEIDLLVAIAAQVAQSIQHARLYADAQRRVHELEALAKISEAVSESLYLEESLEAIVKTTIARRRATGAALVLEDGRDRLARGQRRRLRRPPAAALEAAADRRARLRPRHALHGRGSRRCSSRSPITRPSRSSTAAPSCAACSPRRSTTASRTTCRPWRRCCGCRRAHPSVDARRALTDSVNRILAIAAVHEVLTEHRDDDVDLAELIERLRAMIVQGLGAGKAVEATARAGLAGRRSCDGARARLQRALPERARARRRHGPDRARPPRRRRRARRSPTTAPALTGAATAPGSRSCARSCATSCRGRSS